jgi:phage I-like protein
MKFKKPKLAIAALTNQCTTSLAVLSFSVGAINSNQIDRVQLLPSGLFASKDGRPEDVAGGKWLMDQLAFEQLKANAALRENDYHFDYEHQTMYTEKNGKPAPAAGWFKDFEYVEGEGLFALKVDWTPNGQKAVTNKDYRYTSAVFAYDTQTGRPTNLLHVALTNDPALDGMKAIAALKAKPNLPNPNHPGEDPMNEALKLMLDWLGIAHSEPDFANAAALKKTQDSIETAIAALKTKADKSGQLEKDLNTANESVVALKAGGNKGINPTEFVPIGTYNAVNQELAALKNGTDKNSVEQLLKDNAAKITGQADREYLTSVGESQGAAVLKDMLEPRLAIAALTDTQTQNKKPPAKDEAQVLSVEQVAMCKNMGISQKDFQEQLVKSNGDS